MRKEIRWAALLLAVLMLTGCAHKAQKEVPELLEPVGVQATDKAVAYIGEIHRTDFYSASIKPYVEALSFKVNGQVMEINGYPGMMVEEGDVLIELDQVTVKERSEQLQQDINYAQQDGAYSDEIAALDIEILSVELRKLEKEAASLKEKETALKEADTTLKEKEAALKESIASLKEKETALEKSIAELKEKEAVLMESEPAPEESEPTPETSEPAPETSESTPDVSDPAPETSEPVPEGNASTPEESETPPEESAPVPQESELELVQKEIELAEKELALVKNEITIAEKEIEIAATEIAQAAEELVKVTEEIPLAEKAVALKKNEIEQTQTLLRQDKELRALELQNKRKQQGELSISLDENVIRAPFSGRIIYGDVLTPGSWVQAEDPVVFLSDDSKISIVCPDIPDTLIERADRIFACIGEKEYELKHIPIDPDEYTKKILAGEEVNTKFEIVATEAELAKLEAGQYAAVHIWRDYIPDALLIPSNAVQTDAAGKYVYVEENGTRVKRTVKTGLVTDSLTQITEGLKEGDVVYVKE